MLIPKMAFIFRKSKQSVKHGEFKEIVKEEKYVRRLASVLISDFVLCR